VSNVMGCSVMCVRPTAPSTRVSNVVAPTRRGRVSNVVLITSTQGTCVERGVDSAGCSTPSTRCEEHERTREILLRGVLPLFAQSCLSSQRVCSHKAICGEYGQRNDDNGIIAASPAVQSSHGRSRAGAASGLGRRVAHSLARPLNQSYSLSFQFLPPCRPTTSNTTTRCVALPSAQMTTLDALVCIKTRLMCVQCCQRLEAVLATKHQSHTKVWFVVGFVVGMSRISPE
jgi:hypothetical protein